MCAVLRVCTWGRRHINRTAPQGCLLVRLYGCTCPVFRQVQSQAGGSAGSGMGGFVPRPAGGPAPTAACGCAMMRAPVSGACAALRDQCLGLYCMQGGLRLQG